MIVSGCYSRDGDGLLRLTVPGYSDIDSDGL